MSMRWFDPKVAYVPAESYIMFSHNPKGFKLSATLYNELKQKKVTHLKIGLEGTLMILQPGTEEDGFRIDYSPRSDRNPNPGQILSKEIHSWADGEKLMRKKVPVTFNPIAGTYKGNLLNAY